MLDRISGMIVDSVNQFISGILKNIFDVFGDQFMNATGSTLNFLQLDIVQKTILYSKTLVMTLLVTKTIFDALQTYILYQNGDPESDPNGLLVRTAQAVLIVGFIDEVIRMVFDFGYKVANDVKNLGTGALNFDADGILKQAEGSLVILIMTLILFVGLIIVMIQSAIRGAEIALMAVIGPFLALNITSHNRSTWSSYFKQLVILSLTQAIQMFMVRGFSQILVSYGSSGFGVTGLLPLLGWMWVIIKSPKFVQQFAHSTGFSGTVGGGGRMVAQSMLMRRVR